MYQKPVMIAVQEFLGWVMLIGSAVILAWLIWS